MVTALEIFYSKAVFYDIGVRAAMMSVPNIIMFVI